MSLRKIILLASVLFATAIQAQDLTIHVDKKGKVGFVDNSGKIVVKCEYESATPFENGYSIVTKSQKSGVIDQTGKVVLPLKYKTISPWTTELYMLNAGKTQGLATHSGKIVLPAKYSFISKPNCYGKALIAVGGKQKTNDKKKYMLGAKYGVIDINGNIVIKPDYKGLYEFSYDGASDKAVAEGKRLEYSYHYLTDTLKTDCEFLGFNKHGLNALKSGILDNKGKILLKPFVYSIVMQPKSGMVRYYEVKKKETICGYYNLTSGKGFEVAKIKEPFGQIVSWTHGDFCGDVAPVNGTSWSFIDKTGKVLRQGYTELSHGQYSGLWAAKKEDGRCDVFDDFNQDVTALSNYQDVLMPSTDKSADVFAVKKGNLYGVVNRNGQTIVPFEYERASGNRYDFIALEKDGKMGAVAPSGKIIIPIKYVAVVFPDELGVKDYWVKKEDSLYYHFNSAQNFLGTVGYEAVTNFKNHVALVIPVGMKLENSEVNRALYYAPNTDHATIDKFVVKKELKAYGYIVNSADEIVFDMPVTPMYLDSVIKLVNKQGGKKLREYEKKNILLEVTKENRSYGLKTTLGENEWNY